MGIFSNLTTVKTISSTSTQGVITTSNENFKKITNALFQFLKKIGYEEDSNSLLVNKIEGNAIKSNSTISVINDKGSCIIMDNNGKIYSIGSIKSMSFVEAPMFKVNRISSTPVYGNGGEIIYANNDFYGYVNGRGWVSLTDGGGVTPSPEVDSLYSIISTIIDIVDTLPETGSSGEKYIISAAAEGDLAEWHGYIAVWNGLNWEYVLPEDGEIAVVKEKENGVYVSNIDGTVITWIAPESGDIIARIEVLDQKVLDIYHEALSAFLATNGMGYDGNLGYHKSISKVHADNVFISNIDSSSSNQTIELTKLSDTSFKIGEEYLRGLITPEFGENYKVKVLANGEPVVEDGTWFFQYNSGILYFKEKPTTDPTHVTIRHYTGEYLSASVGGDNPDKVLHVGSVISTNNANTGLSLSKTSTGYVEVLVNGIAVTVYDGGNTDDFDCYFTNVSDSPIVDENGMAIGSKLFWNAETSGYPLDLNDTIAFIYM